MISQRSLTQTLMAWALGALLIVWGGFVAWGYRTGIHEADELTDGHLASVALLHLAGQPDGASERHRIAELPELSELKNHDYQRSMSLVVWDGNGKVLMHRGDAATPPFTQKEGFETLELGSPPVSWRVFSRWDGPLHQQKIAVLLSVSERDELAHDIAEQVAEPGFWLLPVVALALGLAIYRGLQPLYQLTKEVDALDIREAMPLKNTHRQEELRSVVNSINMLAGRFHKAVSKERDLANEMAHELRTPLASIALQARALRQAPSEDIRELLLVQLESDVLRAGHVLSDLLALARASRTELAEDRQAIDLDDIARQEVAAFAHVALRTGHELALVSPGPFLLCGHPVLLALAVRNLIENALSHTPRGTLVEVRLNPDELWLEVRDVIEPNFATHEKPVSDPPIGVMGIGLGHRVIAKIAEVHSASFSQISASDGFTGRYRISFSKTTSPETETQAESA